MPNITWQEPQIIVDLLAMNLIADELGMELPGDRSIAVVSPWLSNVELFLRPCPWQQQLSVGEADPNFQFRRCLERFLERDWHVDVAVLQYDTHSASGLWKSSESFTHEKRLLKHLEEIGASVFLLPDLHAKGLITPLGIITGSTNITRSGLYAQAQNANYFAWNHPDYDGNRSELLGKYAG